MRSYLQQTVNCTLEVCLHVSKGFPSVVISLHHVCQQSQPSLALQRNPTSL